jgi:hypothetical protein
VIGRRLLESTADDHSESVAKDAVTRRTENVEALMPALDQFLGNGNGEYVNIGLAILGGLAGIEFGVALAKISPGNGIRDIRTGLAVVSEKLGLAERLVLRLIVHVLTATGEKSQTGQR